MPEEAATLNVRPEVLEMLGNIIPGSSGGQFREAANKVAAETPAEPKVEVVNPPAEVPPATSNADANLETKEPENKIPETPKPEAVKEPEEDLLGDNPFLQGLKNKQNKTPEVAPESIKTLDDITATINKKYGMNLKDASELPKYFETVDKFRKDSQELGEIKTKVDGYEKIFQNLPEELYGAVQAHYEGGDWKQSLNSAPKLDYNTSVDKQDVDKLITHYHDGVTAEDLTDMDDKVKDTLAKSAKKMFEVDKNNFSAKSAEAIKKAESKIQAQKESVSGSLQHLKSELPHLPSTHESEIKKIMESGDITSHFFNKDGSWSKEAALNLSRILYGQDAIDRAIKFAEKRTETKINEGIIDRASDKLKDVGGGNVKPQNPIVEKVLKNMSGLNQKKTY